jgi:hypothetical protein
MAGFTSKGDMEPTPRRIGTVTVELTYEDALRLWMLVNAPQNAGALPGTNERITRIINEAIAVAEKSYEERPS